MNFGFRARDESRIAILSLRQPKLAKKTMFGTRTHHLGRTPSWNFSRKQIKGPPFHRRTWKWQTIKLERQESTAYLMLGYLTTLFVNWQAIKTCKVWPRASRITSPFKLKDRCPTFFYKAKLKTVYCNLAAVSRQVLPTANRKQVITPFLISFQAKVYPLALRSAR